MVQKVTLNLPEKAIQHAEEIAQRTGRSLEAVLADWIERGSTQENLTSLVSPEQYFYTPLGGDATASALYEFLKSQEPAADS